ncbi:concanavalin A-like lectin/glucanase domain-containing protein [Leucosporidium creatinivorum]|uniref:Concanavalin A-like lectin/glucanase domain-containing protein n=1 Tax=Leucosporidium creatinivorum TaxID=106004 RepID=A0A1Y2G560_9BASI|nr:concanavalin A-like lectin/glucanase domain-containing protein [Leucosporidium creatinivorum]
MNYSAEWPNTLTGSPMASQDLANRMAGPVLMGTAAQLFIAGSVYSNALQYWRSLPSSRDSKPLRFAIVAVLLLLSWACVMCVIDIWSWGVSQNRSAQGLEATSVMDAMTPLPAMLVGVLVQSVFVTRAMSLFTNRRIRNVWTVYMILAITMSFVGGIGTVAMDFRYAFNTVDDALPLNWDIVLSAWMWCSFIVDVSISITMCILLSSRLAGFNERTDSALMSLMYLSIESAVPTAIVALVAGCSLHIRPALLLLPLVEAANMRSSLATTALVAATILPFTLASSQDSHTPIDHSRFARRSKRQPYKLDWKSAGTSFFDDWDFFTETDPTGGSVNYVDSDAAWAQGLVTASKDSAEIKVDSTSWLGNGDYRDSVRIVSKKTFHLGSLVILDLARAPYGPASWPAFWSVGNDWPSQGEIDILEGVNDGTLNQMTLHTTSGCTLATPMSANGTISTTDCDSSGDNLGCAVIDTSTEFSGKGLNDAGGAVFATLFDESGISIWRWTKGTAPSDTTNGDPRPSNWGKPVAQWAASSCDMDDFFGPQKLIFDITLCGDWAGSDDVWASAGYSKSCSTMVQDPTNFVNAVFEVNSVQVFKQK